MKKTIFAALFLVFGTGCYAQTESTASTVEMKERPMNNIIKLSGNVGALTSKIIDGYSTTENAFVSGFSFDYAHVGKNSMGFGINLSRNYISVAEYAVYYIGGSFVIARTTNKGWRWEVLAGLGYAHSGIKISGSEDGIGLLTSAGITYKLDKHWGIGADIRAMSMRYSEPDGWDSEKNGAFGTRHFDLSAGIRYFF